MSTLTITSTPIHSEGWSVDVGREMETVAVAKAGLIAKDAGCN